MKTLTEELEHKFSASKNILIVMSLKDLKAIETALKKSLFAGPAPKFSCTYGIIANLEYKDTLVTFYGEPK